MGKKEEAGGAFSGTLGRPAHLREAHLHVEPLLHIPAVGLHHRLVLTPHLLQHPVQVHGGRSVHLNVKAVPKLATEGTDFLKRNKSPG